MQCSTYDITLRRVRATTVGGGKEIIVTYCECVFVALVIQRTKRMRLIVICGLSGSTIIFPHYLINGTIKEKLLNTKCVFC